MLENYAKCYMDYQIDKKKCQIFSSPPKKQKILFFHSCQSARGNMYKDKILEFLPLVEFNYSYYNMIIKIDGNGSLGTDCRINCFPTSLILYQCKMNSLMRMWDMEFHRGDKIQGIGRGLVEPYWLRLWISAPWWNFTTPHVHSLYNLWIVIFFFFNYMFFVIFKKKKKLTPHFKFLFLILIPI